MNHLKIVLRALMHYKFYSAINVLGLTLSLACVLIIFRYVYSELTVDRFNKKLDRTFITVMEHQSRPGYRGFSGISNPNNEAGFVDLSKNPGVEKHALFFKQPDTDLRINEQTYNTDVLVADTVFMQIMDFPVIAGQANFIRPEEAFISEDFARKVFGKESPVGKKIFYPAVNKEISIIGIIGKPATKSALSFEVILAHHLAPRWSRMTQSLILLYPQVDYRNINQQYSGFMEMKSWQESINYQLYPYKDVYLGNDIGDYGLFAHGKHIYVWVLSVVGILLLLTGVVNYININTVVILRRNREYGMKKIFGAEGYKVFSQLFLENLFLVAGSLLFAFGFADLLNPVVENIFEIEQFRNIRFDALLLVVLLVALPAVTSIAPFFKYNYSSPVTSLHSVNMGGKSLFTRRFFLAFQYFITLTMITVSLFFIKQLHFMLHQDLGYRTKNIISVPFIKQDGSYMTLSVEEFQAKEEKLKEIANELKQKMDASTLFECWTNGRTPNQQNVSSFNFKVAGGEQQPVNLINANEKWLKLFEIKLLNGRLWNDSIDSFYGYVAIAGESTLRQYGITDYETAELQPFRRIWWSSVEGAGDMSQNPPYKIVGVVKDFYTAHLSQKQLPVVFYYTEGYSRDPIIASFAPERRKEALHFMRNLHEELVGGEFTCSFIEDEIAAVYKEDKKITLIYSTFTFIAILISVLGLFGVSLFDIRQRRKEIAIRKVNGASVKDIARLLLKRYFVLLGVAFAVSVPVALFAIYKYLENFAFRSPVSWWLFALSGLITAAVSLLTLYHQIRKACGENPAEVLKTE